MNPDQEGGQAEDEVSDVEETEPVEPGESNEPSEGDNTQEIPDGGEEEAQPPAAEGDAPEALPEDPTLSEENQMLSGTNLLADDEETNEELPTSYDYFIYGWGYDDFGQLARGPRSGGEGQEPHPVRFLRSLPEDTSDSNTEEDAVLNPGGITGGQSFSAYWF